MTHAQFNTTGRRRDCVTSWRVGKVFDTPQCGVSRRELLKSARDAVRALALDRSERQLIECLAVCFGEQQLAHGLLCWPSNAQIEKRTGMSERTIRRAIVRLRERGLILLRDSANGKRFPISNVGGDIVDARGFDLTPLHARATEFAERVRALEIEDRLRRQLRDDLVAARNTLFDLCADGALDGYDDILARAKAVARPSKAAAPEEFAAAIEAYVDLAEEARVVCYQTDPSAQLTGSAGHPDRHSEQDSKPSIEDCKPAPHTSNSTRRDRHGFSDEAFRKRRNSRFPPNDRALESRDQLIPKDLALWQVACPELSAWGAIKGIDRVAVLGGQLIRACGLSGRAFEAASARLGAVNAGLLGLFVVQRHADGEQCGGTPIRSPGGLFVMLAREIERGRHPLEKELIAMRLRRTKSLAAKP